MPELHTAPSLSRFAAFLLYIKLLYQKCGTIWPEFHWDHQINSSYVVRRLAMPLIFRGASLSRIGHVTQSVCLSVCHSHMF